MSQQALAQAADLVLVEVANEIAHQSRRRVAGGSHAVLATPDGRVFINPTGNAGLGTAGAGDTLTGLISGFLAQAYATLEDRADPIAATIAALYVGGLAGDFAAKELGMRTMLASDIREHFTHAIRSLDPLGELP